MSSGSHLNNPPTPPAQYEPQLNIQIGKTKASQDSEDNAHISDANSSSNDETPADLVNSHAIGCGPISKQVATSNGHHDVKQRRIYLGLLAFAIFNALIGFSLILVWMLHYRPVTGFGLTDKGHLSNLHVILMFTFMVSLNMYAVLIYRTHYSRPKQQLKWAHAILTGTNMLMALLGVAAMYKAHLIGNLANFYSLHSWIGAMTNGFYVAQFSFGFAAFLKPGMSAQLRQQLMPWHRKVGTFILILAGTAAITGIAELVIFQDRDGAYQKFTPITFIANFAGISVVLMTATSVYLLTASQYLRPPLTEEMPIRH